METVLITGATGLIGTHLTPLLQERGYEVVRSGAYNAVAPEHVTNKTLTRAIGRAIKRPVFLPPVPAFLLTLGLGEKAGIVLEGSRASCERIKDAGFEFRYEQLDAALQECVRD